MTCIRLKAAATFVPPLTAGCRKRHHVPTVHCPWLKSVQTLAAEQRSLSHCSIHLQTKDFARRTMYLRYIIPVYMYIRHGLSRLKTIFSLATLSFQTPAGRETLRLRLAGMVTPQCWDSICGLAAPSPTPQCYPQKWKEVRQRLSINLLMPCESWS